jgi:hypothetical protein
MRGIKTVYGFATRADAIKWIRGKAVAWLYEKPTSTKSVAAN